MNFQADYFTSTREFEDKEIGESGYYHWKKFKKYFKKGNQILVRNSKSKTDYLIKLIEDPERIPLKFKKHKWYNQQYWVKYEITKRISSSKGKSRLILKEEKEKLLHKMNYGCPGLKFKSKFSSQPIVIRCKVKFNESIKPEFDHIIDFSTKGGLTATDNLEPLCKGCHSVKTALTRRELILLLESKFKRA